MSVRLIDLDRGLINPSIFVDNDIYKEELARIFGRCWLYVGHESSIPEAGDFISNFMGEDAIVVTRDQAKKIHVLLNRCRHRGNKVCLHDKGNVRSFFCTYHGWTYDNAGKLVGVPLERQAWLNQINRQALGLAEAPKVATYGGMIFACWDPDVIPLDQYLGEARWYLDRGLIQDHFGGMEVVGGRQRYVMPANWKLLADNFASDGYHFHTSHASFVKTFAYRLGQRKSANEAFQANIGYGSGVPHGFGAIRTGEKHSYHDRDMQVANRLGKEAVEWVEERYRRQEEYLRDDRAKLQIFANGNIFPNFSVISGGSAFQAKGLMQWHPRGPSASETFQWCAVERDAPRIVKQAAIRELIKGQAGGGMIATDDTENFERTSDNLNTHETMKQPFDYSMALGHDLDHPRVKELQVSGLDPTGLPGVIGPYDWDVNSRQFFRYWGELMGETAR